MAQHDPDTAPAPEHVPEEVDPTDLIPLRQDEEGDVILPLTELARVVGLRAGDYLHFGVDKQDPEEPAITLEPVPEDPEIAPSANPEVRKVSERLDVYGDAPGEESLLASKVPKFCIDDRGLDLDLDSYDGGENPLYLEPIVLRGAIILVPIVYADGQPYEPPTEGGETAPDGEEASGAQEEMDQLEEESHDAYVEMGEVEADDVDEAETEAEVETETEAETEPESEDTGPELAWVSPAESEAARTTAPIYGIDVDTLGEHIAALQSAARDASLQGVMAYPPVTVDADALEASVTVPGDGEESSPDAVHVVIVDESEFADVADTADVPDDAREAAREAMEWAAEDVLASVSDLSTDYRGFNRDYTALVYPAS